MKTTSPKIQLFSSALITLFLVACGGGGSGGGGSNSPPPAADVPITTANSEAVARASYRATTVLGLVLPARPENRGTRLGAPRVPQACDISGTVDAPASGDFGTYIFMDCEDEPGFILNGTAVITGSGDIDGPTFNGTFTVTNIVLSGSSVPQSATLNGTISISWTTSGVTETGTETANFTVTAGGDTFTVANYNDSYTANINTGQTNDTLSFTVTSSSIGGTVNFTTDQVFVSIDPEPFPRTGRAIISGSNGSKVRVTAQGSGQPNGPVLLETDADGDNIYEDSKTVTWLSLAL